MAKSADPRITRSSGKPFLSRSLPIVFDCARLKNADIKFFSLA